VKQPLGFPFNLNSAVDSLLKKEFDEYREEGKPHPLMVELGVEAVPFAHEELEELKRLGLRFTRFRVIFSQLI